MLQTAIRKYKQILASIVEDFSVTYSSSVQRRWVSAFGDW